MNRKRSRTIIPSFVAFLAAALLATLATSAQAQWGNSRGGPERDGARDGSAELPVPQVKWKHDLGGTLGSSSIWQIPDPIAPRVALTVGGRVSLKRWDDSLSWRGQLLGLSRFIAAGDTDSDGGIDLLFTAGGSVKSTVVGYTPDGDAVFRPEPGLLGVISSGARFIDLDGDGFRDLYLTSIRPGPNNIIAAAYRFVDGNPTAGELMYTIDSTHRDYRYGFGDVIAELDGTPGLEILALGHRSLYVYDAETGALESTTELSGPVPYGRATLRLVDLDRNGISEVFAFSNQAWSENNNRRHVTLFAHSGGRMGEVWKRDLGATPSARLRFTDSSIVNLDETGEFEAVFSVQNSAGEWTTEIRDAGSGVLLETIVGERLEDIATTSVATFLFTHDDGEPLRSYRFSRATGLERVGAHRDLRLIRCRRDRPIVGEVPRQVPCSLPVAGIPRVGILASEYDAATNAVTAIVSLDSSLDGALLDEVARFDGRGGRLSAVLEIAPGHQAVIAVAHSDGTLFPLDEKLRFLGPSPKPPFSWGGVRYGSRFSGFDLPGFPLVVPSDDAEPIAALTGSGRAAVLDASGEVSVVAGIETVWTGGYGNRLAITNAPDSSVVVIDSQGDISAHASNSGEERWRVTAAFTSASALHNDPLVVEDQLWFHRRNNNTGIYDLTSLNTGDGTVAFVQPNLDANDGGWRRLSLATWDGVPAPISGRVGEVWRFDLDGNVADAQSSSSASFAIPVPGDGVNPLLIIDGLRELSAFDPESGLTLWTIPRVNTSSPRHGALLTIDGAARYATTDADRPMFRAINVLTGGIDMAYQLVGGELLAEDTELAVSPPLLGNVSAISDITGNGDPAYLVGSSDGFVYAIHAVTSELIWALFVGAQVGEIVLADWDGDSLLELVASTADGRLLGIDRFTGSGPAWVHDTDGRSNDDIDELVTTDTLNVAWAEVDGATGYEVAVFTNDGQSITSGFTSTGSTRTSLTISGLDLEPGLRYVVSVRAISDLGVSPDEPSDGVTVLLPPPDTSTGGCCQVSGSSRGGLEALLLTLFCGALIWRRRRPHAPRSNR